MSQPVVPRWCHPTWDYIHTWADHLPEHPDAKETEQTIKGWLIGISCQHPCRPEALQYFANNPVELDSRTKIREAMWMFHNYINRKLNKREMTWTEYENRYNQRRSPAAAAARPAPAPVRTVAASARSPLIWSAGGFVLTFAALHFLLSKKNK